MQNDMKTNKTKRLLTLVLPLTLLFLFVALFVGSGIYRSTLRKELTEMKETSAKRDGLETRLTEIKEHNQTISYIIGRDEETEQLIETVEALQ